MKKKKEPIISKKKIKRMKRSDGLKMKSSDSIRWNGSLRAVQCATPSALRFDLRRREASSIAR